MKLVFEGGREEGDLTCPGPWLSCSPDLCFLAQLEFREPRLALFFLLICDYEMDFCLLQPEDCKKNASVFFFFKHVLILENERVRKGIGAERERENVKQIPSGA